MKVYVDWRGVNYPGAEGAGYEVDVALECGGEDVN